MLTRTLPPSPTPAASGARPAIPSEGRLRQEKDHFNFLSLELLAANWMHYGPCNVTLLSLASSDGTRLLPMAAPKFETLLTNYHMASTTAGDASVPVLCVAVVGLALPGPIRFAKIDAEGDELEVLHGMPRVLQRDQPTLVDEGQAAAVADDLRPLGYSFTRLDGSPNRVYRTG